MTEFEINYLDLLARQVNEEIAFLKLHGHSNANNYPRCSFCYENRTGGYNCGRLEELKQFQSSIAISRNQDKSVNRRPIGVEVVDSPISNTSSLSLLPLLKPL